MLLLSIDRDCSSGWGGYALLVYITLLLWPLFFFLFLILHIGRDIFGGFAGHEWYFDASKGHTRNFSFSLDLNFVFCYCSTPTEVQEKILKGGWIRILCLDIYVLLMMLVFGQVNFSSWVVVFFLFFFLSGVEVSFDKYTLVRMFVPFVLWGFIYCYHWFIFVPFC